MVIWHLDMHVTITHHTFCLLIMKNVLTIIRRMKRKAIAYLGDTDVPGGFWVAAAVGAVA
jgi:hypothetical protein